jgi:heme/copper-type cytochrome/quinol oxidase subunit 3
MKLVIGTEAMFFLALIMAFIYLSFNSGFETGQQQKLKLLSTGIFTIFLMCSSLTFWLAEKSYNKGNVKYLKAWLCITIVLGAVFLCGQAKEYLHLIHEQQITLSSSLFGTGFFTLTGFHGLHVVAGLIILSILFAMSLLGDFNKPGSSVINAAGMYWHFVDIVWIVVFTIVYVLPRTDILN